MWKGKICLGKYLRITLGFFITIIVQILLISSIFLIVYCLSDSRGRIFDPGVLIMLFACFAMIPVGFMFLMLGVSLINSSWISRVLNYTIWLPIAVYNANFNLLFGYWRGKEQPLSIGVSLFISFFASLLIIAILDSKFIGRK